MAKQKIVWTAVPYGRVTEGPLKGCLRVSVVVSPRLTPLTAPEQKLGAPGHAEFHDWPRTLSRLKLQLQIAGVPGLLPLEPLNTASSELWTTLFTADTPVAGFQYQDMSRVNLRSFAVRNVLGFVREHYGKLAVASAGTHPTLLPWKNADPSLKGMLSGAGTRTQKIDLGHSSLELPLPGFDRFLDGADSRDSMDKRLGALVFGSKGRYRAPVVGIDGQPTDMKVGVRALPPDWADPAANGPDKELMAHFTTADEYTLYQANRFYRRSVASDADKALRRPDLKNLPEPITIEDFDFHRIIASLADTPAVLRQLGLIIDCALPADDPISAALANAASVDGAIGVEVEWGDPHAPAADAYPRTAFRASATRFLTRERSAEHAQGLMRLQGSVDPTLVPGGRFKPRSAFDVYQLDPDGAALKTTDFVLTAQNLVARSLKPGTHGEVAYTTGDRQPVAALRSGGLGISRHGRAGQVAIDAAGATLKNAALEASAATTRKVLLFAEDLLRGYRVDVQNQGKWFSLCRRVGDYRVTQSGQTLDLPPDEGYVKGASTTGDGGDDHYLHESVFRWTGWSLCAPRPGRRIAPSTAADSGLQGEEVVDTQEVADNGNGLAVRFRAEPGTLPRLRFGQDYRLRARIVDLAGNSLGLDEPDGLEQATEPVSYLRFEPVDPPALVHKHRVSEGESLERMVLRSNYDADPKAYLSTAPFKAAIQLPASADFEYVAQNQRHVVPPKASQLQCELHGLFDAAFGGGTPAAIKAAYKTAAREAGTLYDPLPGTNIELVTPQSVASQALTTTAPPALPSADAPTGGRLVGGQYVLHREDRVTTPYLPDGAAGGFALRGDGREDMARIGITQPMDLGDGAFVVRVPQTEELVLIVRNGKDWPDTQGLRIVIDERAHTLDDGPCAESFPDDGRPKWDAGKRVLTLFLRKGHIARLRYSSFVDKRFIDTLGLPRWSDSAGQRAFIAELALHGVHWMVTPYRALVLVHATQAPVCTPRLMKVSAPRSEGQTFTDLDAAVQLHGASTGKFEVVAEWQEWIDDPQQPRPIRKTMRGTLGEIPLPENHVNQFMLASAANAVQLPPATGLIDTGDKRTRGNRHEFGDTKFRLVRYRLEATTRFREYLPAALYAQRDQITRLGPPALETSALLGADDDPGAAVLFSVAGATPNGTRVRSTQAPEVPRVVYAVPTFRWQRNLGTALATQSSTRFGNGLRVYLERPWFSSGDGELLGVVLLADGGRFDTIPEAMMPFVTQWGLDPLFDTTLPKEMAKAADFSARVASENVPLLENGASVHVVGHRVQWDDARKLWYCDIELDAGWRTYMPFVRLALVRYQPHAIGTAKVSRVTLAEFAQVLPRRAATLQRATQLVPVSRAGTLASAAVSSAASAVAVGGIVQRPQTVHTVRLRGPVPERGPMLYTNDSAHLNISFIPAPGTALEAGRNKVELVLQTRAAELDSDLAWTDVATLHSALALPAGAVVENVPGPVLTRGAGAPASLFDEPAQAAPGTVTRSGSLGELQRFDDRLALPEQDTESAPRAGVTSLQASTTLAGSVAASSASASGISAAAAAGLQAEVVGSVLIDPVIWQASITLPAYSGRGRLVLREFERYYTDRTVPDKRGDTVYRKRVVEERLVYSEFFPLD